MELRRVMESTDYRKVDCLDRRWFSSTSILKECLAVWDFFSFPFFCLTICWLLPSLSLQNSLDEYFSLKWLQRNTFYCSDRAVCTFVCFLVYFLFRKISFTKTFFTLRVFLRPILLVFKCQKLKSFFCQQTVIILRLMYSSNSLHSHLQAGVSTLCQESELAGCILPLNRRYKYI